MKKKSLKTLPYLEARHQLQINLYKLADKNGRLPSERILCEQLSVSHSTLRKVINELKCEGSIVSLERKGNYLPHRPAYQDIGLILDNNKVAPFIASPSILSGIMESLAAANRHARILIPKRLDTVEILTQQYNLSGIIWNNPSKAAVNEILSIHKNTTIGVSLIFTPSITEAFSLHNNCVLLDYEANGKNRAEFFLNRKCRRVLYIGAQGIGYRKFQKTMQMQSIKSKPEWLYDSSNVDSQILIEIIKREKIDGIVSEGSQNKLFNLFAALSVLEESQQPQLLIDYTSALPLLREKFPTVKISSVSVIPYYKFGTSAAKMVLSQLKDKKKQSTVLLQPEITSLEKLSQPAI